MNRISVMILADVRNLLIQHLYKHNPAIQEMNLNDQETILEAYVDVVLMDHLMLVSKIKVEEINNE